METLRQPLLCPMCLELFTPPILLLSRAHNFCKQCREKILLHQNCHHANGSSHCPLCRKVICLRGRGIVALLENSLVESILEKFKYELEKNLYSGEKRQLYQICQEHGENMNLMCLTDKESICASCKLFGKQEDHKVAKVSEAYSETEKLMNELTAGATDTKVMTDTAGTGLLTGVWYQIAELQSKLHHDCSTRLEKLQVISNDAEASGQLYQQMEALLEHHENSVHFLQEDKKIKEKIEKVDPPKHKISM
ncbi:tripartite motif-containing protein 54-like [Cariama cristata]